MTNTGEIIEVASGLKFPEGPIAMADGAAIEFVLNERLGLQVASLTKTRGGDINDAFRAVTAAGPIFVKSSPTAQAGMFTAEAGIDSRSIAICCFALHRGFKKNLTFVLVFLERRCQFRWCHCQKKIEVWLIAGKLQIHKHIVFEVERSFSFKLSSFAIQN